MRVAVISTVVFEVPDGLSLETIRNQFYMANVFALGNPRIAIGEPPLPFTMVRIDSLKVERA